MHTLFIVATPIGNLDDITIRAIKTLLTIPTILCEDTRHTGQLLKILKERYGNLVDSVSDPKLISVRDFNEAESLHKVLTALQAGDAALVSDAGTPLISDPGYKVVAAARAAGFNVSPVPGASAATAALSAAGLPTNRVLFMGFLGKKWELQPESTHVIYESPLRLQTTLAELYMRYPRAEIVVAKELTKIHEEFVDGRFPQLPKGEVTIVVYLPAE